MRSLPEFKLKWRNIQREHTFIVNATNDVVNVVGEESLVVEYCRQHGSDGWCTHLLVVFMFVHLQCTNIKLWHKYLNQHFSTGFTQQSSLLWSLGTLTPTVQTWILFVFSIFLKRNFNIYPCFITIFIQRWSTVEHVFSGPRDERPPAMYGQCSDVPITFQWKYPWDERPPGGRGQRFFVIFHLLGRTVNFILIQIFQ